MRSSFAIIVAFGLTTPVSEVFAGECLAPIMSSAGQQVMSPYGMDRSGRPGASAGYHQGLDIVNDVGRGDPIKAGVDGRVVVSKDGSGGQKVVVETLDGSQRFGFYHLDGRSVRAGETVSAGTQVGTQGSTGVSRSAVHLHLTALMSGDALQDAGGQSRVWFSPSGWIGAKRSPPMTAQQVSAAAPSSFYFVNPETFIDHRIPFAAGLLSAQEYQDQGLVRPGGLTLEPTCLPANLPEAGAASSNGGLSIADGETGAAAGKASDIAHASDMAASEVRDAYMSWATAALGDLADQQRSVALQGHRNALLASLLATELDR